MATATTAWQSQKQQHSKSTLPMVKLVGHALVNGTVGLDVDNVTGLVGLEVGAQGNGALFPKVAGKHVPSPGAETK
jgi:hypothetical protein